MNDRTWAIYLDSAAELAAIRDEGPDAVGASGSNWQSGYTASEAREFLARKLAEGYLEGADRNSRF